jgi:hypothetical protein
MHSKEMKVTPKIAKEWLKKNTFNRPCSNHWVRILADRMRNNEWELNGEPIIISDKGNLLDGQHRLEAIVLSGIAITTIVTFGINETTFETLGGGKKRSIPDGLAIRGESNTPLLAALLRMVYKYERTGELTASLAQLTPKKAFEVLEEHPELRHCTLKGKGFRERFKFITGSTAAFCYWRFSKIDLNATDSFFESLVSGANIQKGSPILQLRDKMIFTASTNAKLNNAMWCHFIFKAWNLWRKGTKRKANYLHVKSDEKFPTPV